MTNVPVPELTTVGPTEAVVHTGTQVERFTGLAPDTAYELGGFAFRTLPEPGELLCRFATVNDVHFGETECGLMSGMDTGPVLRSEPGEDPYPVTMSRGAVAEIAAVDPAVVVAKGDLTSGGEPEEYQAFLDCYEGAFGDRLVHVRGNHDAYDGADFAAFRTQEVELPGVRLAVLDTSRVARAGGALGADQVEWLDELADRSDRPVVVLGHHHPWSPDSANRPGTYFGIEPESSEALVGVAARRPSIVGYFAGHTHRNRVRRFAATGDLPWVEVASVKDYPGAWAEYLVYDGGILQVVHRVSTPEALAWTERTRAMFHGTYGRYALGTLADRCFALPGDRRHSR